MTARHALSNGSSLKCTSHASSSESSVKSRSHALNSESSFKSMSNIPASVLVGVKGAGQLVY